MLRAILSSFFLSLTLLLTACGSDGNSAASGGSSAASMGSSSSVAAKGILKDASIQVLKWEAGAYVPVETVQTNSEGAFTLTLPDHLPGDVYKLVLAHRSTDAAMTMVCDVPHCGSYNFGEDMPFTADMDLASWVTVSNEGAITIMPVTPVSTLLVSYAEFLGNGRLTSNNIAMARTHVAALFRMSPADLMAVPGNIASAPMAATMTEASRKISLLSAAFAELSGGDAAQMGADIQRFSQAFVDNNGRLMEAGGGVGETLHNLYTAAYSVADVIASPSAQTLALNWINGVKDALVSGELSSTCRNPAGCAEFNSERFVDSLGAMGTDIRTVIGEHGYETLEHAISGELNKFGWLISADTVALTSIALQTAGYTVSSLANTVVADMVTELGGGVVMGGASSLFPLEPINGLYPTLEGNVLTVAGTQNGLNVDLTITLPTSTWAALKNGSDKKFPVSVKGVVGNERIQGDIDAAVLIDATGTDFTAFTDALKAVATNMGQVMQKQLAMASVEDEAVRAQYEQEIQSLQLQTFGLIQSAVVAGADLAKTAKFRADIDFNKARLVKLDDNSRLSMEGKGFVVVDMKGGENNRITLNGEVSGGEIMLPNGSWFAVDKTKGEYLTFQMDKDGSFAANASASVLTLFKGKGQGTLKNMGVMVSNLRDSIVDGITSGVTGGQVDLAGMLAQLLTDVGTLDLLVEGDVTMVEPGKSYTGHVYKARLANTTLTISQPNKPITNKALEMTLSFDGLMVKAGDSWWQFGLDVSDLLHPAILIADDLGGSWRYTMDFSGLFGGFVATN